MKLYFLSPGDSNSLTGGYLYNKRIIEELVQKGSEVILLNVSGPLSHNRAIESSCRQQFGKLPQGSCIVIDSLVFGLLSNVIKENKDNLKIIGLIHLPASFNPTEQNTGMTLACNDQDAMRSATHLIVTGRFMKHLLQQAGVAEEKISVAEPGVDIFPRKVLYPKLPAELLCISNYSEIKAQLVLVKALNKLRKRDWTLRMYGNLNTDVNYVNSLISFIMGEKLQNRILVHDILEHKKITSVFLRADLFVLPSLFESYGMVLTESLAHGIPVVSTTAGNIQYTVPAGMGLFSEPGNADDLASVLDELFLDQDKYRSLCEASAGYHRQALSWKAAADRFERIILNYLPGLQTKKG